MSAVQWLAGLAFAVAVLVAGDVASEEIRGRLDRLPSAVLRLARSRLPAGLRESVHDQEWVPELEHVLQHAELFPLTRLLTGLRFAFGLLIRARAVAAELQPAEAANGDSSGRTWRQRLATRSAAVLRAVIWPIREPLPVRLYVAGVILAGGAAASTAVATTAMHARDLELCVILLACCLIAHKPPAAPRGQLIQNLTGAWLLPAAVLLPPLYTLIAPLPVYAVEQLRYPSLPHRRAFGIATNSLVYGAISVLAHAVAAPAAGHIIPPGTTLPAWILVIAACELLAAAGTHAAILIAIKGSTPGTHVLPLAANRNTALRVLTTTTLGIAATLAAATYPPLAIAIIPAAIVATRRIDTTTPGPPLAS